jgi:hypothetical protein
MTVKEIQLGLSGVAPVIHYLKLELDTICNIEAAIAEIDEIYRLKSLLIHEQEAATNTAYHTTRAVIIDL